MGVKSLCESVSRFILNPTCLFSCGGANILCPCTLNSAQQDLADICYPFMVILITVVCVAAAVAFLICCLNIVIRIRQPYDQVISSKNTKVQTKYFELMIEKESNISSIPFDNSSNLYQIVEAIRRNPKKPLGLYAAELGGDPLKCMAVLLWLVASDNNIGGVTAQTVFDMYKKDVEANFGEMATTFLFNASNVIRIQGNNQYIANNMNRSDSEYVFTKDSKLYFKFAISGVCPYVPIGSCQLINNIVDWQINIDDYPIVSLESHPHLDDCYERTLKYRLATQPFVESRICCRTRSAVNTEEYFEDYILVQKFLYDSVGIYVAQTVDIIQRHIQQNGNESFPKKKIHNLEPQDYAYCKRLNIQFMGMYTDRSLNEKVNNAKELINVQFEYVNPQYEQDKGSENVIYEDFLVF